MANEIQVFLPTGGTLYAVVLNTAGQVWNGSAFETVNGSNWADYDIALTESVAGLYLGDLPALSAGLYNYVVYEQAGASPANTDTIAGTGYLEWDGSAVLPLSSIDADLATIDGIVDDILADTGTDIPASLTTIQADLDNPDQYKADVSALPSASDVWDHTSRTLTMTATEIEASVSGSSITQIRGNSWDIDIPDLTLDSNKIQFALKRSTWQEDTDAILLIDTDTGLLLVNGEAAADASKASLSYSGTTLTVTVDAEITAQLPERGCYYGIQSITAAGVVSEPYGGTFKITGDIVRSTD